MSARVRKVYLSLAVMMMTVLGLFVQPQSASAALTANVNANKAVELNWSGTGSGPYTLYRGTTLLYNGSGTSYTDTQAGGGRHEYKLNYQNYEEITPGYWSIGSYWGIVRYGYSETKREWRVVVPGHYEDRTRTIPWCYYKSPSGVEYSHSPPCEFSSNETTRTITERVWVPDQYGWVNVTYIYPDEYGWIYYDYWVNAVYGYVTRSTSVTANVPAPPVINRITGPPNGQAYGGNAPSMVPIVSVQDPNGDTLTVTYRFDDEQIARETRTISNTITAQNVSFSSINVSGLTEGRHVIRFTVSDGTHSADMPADFYVDKTAPELSATTVTTAADSISISGTATDALAGMAAQAYRYTVGGTTTAWTSQTSYNQTGLTPNTSYLVRFEARDQLGLTATYQDNVYTEAQTPSVSVTGSTDSTLSIAIDDRNPVSTSYQIMAGSLYVNQSGSLVTEPVWITLSNKKITLTGLIHNSGFSLKASARNEAGTVTSWSNAVVGTTLAKPPAEITTTTTQTSITVNWPTSAGALGYDIEVDGVVRNNGTSTTYTHNSLLPETSHQYRIRVRNAGGIGNWSQLFTVFTLPNPPQTPVNLTISTLQTEVTLGWDAVAKADRYEIEADGVVVDLVADNTYTHTNLLPETTHSYRVRAGNPGGFSSWSGPVSITTLPFPPETPANMRAALSIHTVELEWDPAERAVSYELEVDGLIIDNQSRSTYLHEGLEALSGHTYRVRGVNAGGKSGWSAPLDVTTHPEKPVTPSNLMTMSDESSITVMWHQVPHAESYEVEVDGNEVVSVPDSQFVHIGLEPDTKHDYRVRAKNISGYSEWSTVSSIATVPLDEEGQPAVSLTNIVAIVTNSYITLSWDTVKPNALYEIEVDGVLIDNGEETVYHHADLAPGEFHTYKIRVKDGEVMGDWVALLSLSTQPNPPEVPTDIEAVAGTNSIELRWTKSDDVGSYEIEVDGQVIDIGGNTEFLHEPLGPGTSHTYRVRARNMTGVTVWSPVIVKSTASPTYTLNVERGKPIELTLLAHNVQDFSGLQFVVTFDPGMLNVDDLYDFTPRKDTVSGRIAGSDLSVQVEEGKLIFKVNRNVVPGTSWSGELTTIRFTPTQSGTTSIDVVVD